MAGTYVGIHVREKLDDQQFRKVLLGMLALSAGEPIYRAATM
jgi:uncharacterized membrane protein YfcA